MPAALDHDPDLYQPAVDDSPATTAANEAAEMLEGGDIGDAIVDEDDEPESAGLGESLAEAALAGDVIGPIVESDVSLTAADAAAVAAVMEVTQAAGETLVEGMAAGVAGDNQDDVQPDDVYELGPAVTSGAATVPPVAKQKPDPFTVWRLEMRDAQDRHTSAAIARLKCEGELKSAKEEEKSALKLVMKIAERGPENHPLFDHEPTSSTANGPGLKDGEIALVGVEHVDDGAANIQVDPVAAAEVLALQAAPAVDPDAWRSVSIDELNLKPALASKLKDDGGISTIGQLEDLRAEISQGKAKYPKGIGEAKITAIDDAVVTWLTKNRDAGLFQQVNQVAEQGAAVGDAVDAQTITESNDAPLADAAALNPETATDEQLADAFCARAVELDTGEAGSLDQKHADKRYWDSGYEAYGRDVKVSECPYIPGPEADDWIRGWLGAGKVSNYETPAEAVPVGSSLLSDLDEL